MVYGNLSRTETYHTLLKQPAWKLAFEWLRSVTPSTPLGITELQGEDIYVNVMSYATLPGEQCRYESHRKYVDLQFTITGAEVIDWLDAGTLAPDGGYDDTRDVQFYQPAPTLTRVYMLPGYFGIFFPSDAHRPKVADSVHPDVFKLVIKVNHQLVSA